jgi:hypothetical protein
MPTMISFKSWTIEVVLAVGNVRALKADRRPRKSCLWWPQAWRLKG